MKVDLTVKKSTGFNGAGEDLNSIVTSLMGSENILRLLKYSTPDALSRPILKPEDKASIINKNIQLVPKLPIGEDVDSYIIVLFDTFMPNPSNPLFRDNVIIFDVICHTDTWIMDDFMLRPYKIMHEIDGLFEGQKMNGIGKTEFVAANSLVLSPELAGFTMMYKVVNDI